MLAGSKQMTFLGSLTVEPGWAMRLVGYSLFQCWFFTLSMGGLARVGDVVGGSVFSYAQEAFVLAVALSSVAILLGTLRLVPLSRRKELGVPVALAGTLGTAIAALASVGIAGQGALFTGMVLSGASSAWLVLSWGEYLATQGVRCAMAVFATTSLAGVALLLLLGLLPAGASLVVVCALPLASEVLLRPRRGTRFYANGHEKLTERQMLGNVLHDHSLRLFALYACAACALGMLSEACVPFLAAWAADGVNLMSWGAAAVIVAVSAAFASLFVGTMRPQVLPRLLYPGIALIAAAVALSALVPATTAVAGLFLGSLGLALVNSVLWALMVESSHAHRLPVLGLLASLNATRFIGMAVGQFAGYLCAGRSLPFAVASLCALVLAALLLASLPRSLSVSPEVFEAPVRTSQEARVIALAERSGLTPRETEVLQVWLAGHNAAFVEETLNISRNTVKTHVNHIYQKTGVGSREELLALVGE